MTKQEQFDDQTTFLNKNSGQNISQAECKLNEKLQKDSLVQSKIGLKKQSKCPACKYTLKMIIVTLIFLILIAFMQKFIQLSKPQIKLNQKQNLPIKQVQQDKQSQKQINAYIADQSQKPLHNQLLIGQSEKPAKSQLKEYDKGVKMVYTQNIKYFSHSPNGCGGGKKFSKWPNCSSSIDPYKVSEQDKQQIQKGNISNRALVMSRKYILLGLNQPDSQLIKEQKQYYATRYQGFHNLTNQLPLCIVILSYQNNNNQRYKPALDTVIRQQYQNYHVVYVDDASSDNTGAKAKQYVQAKAKNPQKIQIFINKMRRNYLENFYFHSLQYCQQHDIVIFSPDGDDAIAGTQYFKLINYYYQVYDAWISWGAFIYIENGDLFASKDIQKQFIQSGYLKCCLWQYFHHPLVFYRKTLSMVKPWSFMDLKSGDFYQSNGDNIIMFSQVTMSRFHLKYIPQPVYLYNSNTQFQTAKFTESSESIRRIQQIRDKQQYQQVKCLWTTGHGSCPKASDYIISQLKNNDLKQHIQNIQDQDKSKNANIFNMYPKQIPQINEAIREQDLMYLNKLNISQQSLAIAKQYISIGLDEPSAQIQQIQKQYYTKKYAFSQTRKQFPICVFMTGFNTAQNDRYKLSINSVLRQDYANYRIVYIDDHSTDGSGKLVQQYIKDKSIFKQVHVLVHQRIQRNATSNHYFYSKEHCKQYEIEIILDANDALIGTQVFKLYNYFYQKKDIWTAYSAFITTQKAKVYAYNPLKQQNAYVQGEYYESHLFSFYNKLMQGVKPLSLINQYKFFYWANCNLAIARRIAELTGISRLAFIPQIIYMKIQNHRYSDQQRFSSIEIKKNVERIWIKQYQLKKSLFQLAKKPIQARKYVLSILS